MHACIFIRCPCKICMKEKNNVITFESVVCEIIEIWTGDTMNLVKILENS